MKKDVFAEVLARADLEEIDNLSGVLEKNMTDQVCAIGLNPFSQAYLNLFSFINFMP